LYWPNIIREIKSQYGGDKRCRPGFGVGGILKERDYLEYLGVDGSIMLKSMLKKVAERAWTGLIRLRIGTSGGLFLMR